MNATSAAGSGDFLLGSTLRVNRLGFGAMRLALGGSVRDPEAAVSVPPTAGSGERFVAYLGRRPYSQETRQ